MIDILQQENQGFFGLIQRRGFSNLYTVPYIEKEFLDDYRRFKDPSEEEFDRRKDFFDKVEKINDSFFINQLGGAFSIESIGVNLENETGIGEVHLIACAKMDPVEYCIVSGERNVITVCESNNVKCIDFEEFKNRYEKAE